jgi:hypothetical protein
MSREWLVVSREWSLCGSVSLLLCVEEYNGTRMTRVGRMNTDFFSAAQKKDG